jgi:hypothetical protein
VSTQEPTDDELVAFAESMLQNLGPSIRERPVIEETIQLHRETWAALYEAARRLEGD